MILHTPVYDGGDYLIDTTSSKKEKSAIFSKEKSIEKDIIKDWNRFTQNIHSKNLNKFF